MKKNKTLLVVIAAFVVAAVAIGLCLKPTAQVQEDEPAEEIMIDTLLPVTPVKSQGNGSLCWLYAMLATMETDHLVQGDSVNLSPVYVARQFLAQQARRYYLSHGKTGLSLRGMMTMTLKILEEKGIQPYDYYRRCEDVNWNVLLRRTRQLADAAMARKSGLVRFEQQLNGLLDEQLDYMPRYVHMLGAEYTNEEFGRSVVMPGDWLAMTSFSHHAFGESFVLELADNQFQDSYLNVPIDTLMTTINHSLLTGHPVCWEGDISEPGFSFKKGFAVVEKHGRTDDFINSATLQAMRQRQFEHFQTTDDHCMALVGLAHDKEGHRYYIAKNSWGTDNPYGGYMYLSEDYVRLKTICIIAQRNQVH